ncbi:MAG: hypothetical protein IPF92_30040 [Myxococcales bacterium]|nr:hypothetical protein [Myxococcales bacterium]HQY62866.1 hypothetical protein [Polyangiaceae bacterium]
MSTPPPVTPPSPPPAAEPATRATTPDALLGTFAVLQALTGFVPVPFLDGILSRKLARTMVTTVAGTHSLVVPDDEVRLLASEPDEGLLDFLKSAAKGLLLFPFRLLFRAIFVVLDAKEVTDLVGKAYVHSVLLDIGFAEGWYMKHGAARLGEAVAQVLATVDTRPTNGAVSAAWGALRDKGPELLGRILEAFKDKRDDVAAVEATPLGQAFAEAVKKGSPSLREGLRAGLARALGEPVAPEGAAEGAR